MWLGMPATHSAECVQIGEALTQSLACAIPSNDSEVLNPDLEGLCRDAMEVRNTIEGRQMRYIFDWGPETAGGRTGFPAVKEANHGRIILDAREFQDVDIGASDSEGP